MRFFMIWEVSALSLDVLNRTQTSTKYKPAQPIATSAHWRGGLTRGELCGLTGRAESGSQPCRKFQRETAQLRFCRDPVLDLTC